MGGVEIKSHNDRSFKELVKKGVASAKPSHWRQCQYYMFKRERAKCLYFAVNKNTDDRYSEIIEFSPVDMAALQTRLELIVESARAPARVAKSPDKFPCIMCKHKKVCHVELPQRNCRTCIHATAVIMETGDGWHCEKHCKPLTTDEQKAGCDDHLFHPDMVHGEVIDSSETHVEYKMNDGSIWINGEKDNGNRLHKADSAQAYG